MSDPLGVRSTDPIQRWREDAEQRDAARAQSKRQLAREQRRVIEGEEAAVLRAQMEMRICALEQGYRDLQSALVDAMRAIHDTFDQIADQPVAQRDEIRELKIQVAKLATTVAERNAEGFRFAREQAALDS